jgi:hypothetical protein
MQFAKSTAVTPLHILIALEAVIMKHSFACFATSCVYRYFVNFYNSSK